MNFLAGLFVMHFDAEEDAFWHFAAVVKHYALDTLYVEQQVGLRALMIIFKDRCRQHLPELYNHFKLVSFPISLHCIEWFTTCFVTCFELEHALKIMDVVSCAQTFLHSESW